jgi:adenylate cyclase
MQGGTATGCAEKAAKESLSKAVPHNGFIGGTKELESKRLSQEQRRLAAIMFTDMVGYTALGQRNESLSLALVDEQKKLIRPIIGRHNGREIKTMGDAFLVEFPNALDAVRCAYDIQRTTREANISLPEDKRIHLRVGLHVGDVVESSGDILGDAVNVASRIEPIAEDGGVCLTRQVYDQVHNKFELQLTSLGNKQLKNVASPLEVFKMEMPWSLRSEPPVVRSDQRRIAVLPFANMSPDPNDDYFADGMTEELISTVSRIGDLKVIARTSVMGYKDTKRNIREIADELGADTVLEGSVRKSGDRLRITVQLIDAQSTDYVWSETYDRNFEDIFVIQSEIARKVAETLRLQIQGRWTQQTPRKSTERSSAYAHYLRGRYFWNQRELDGFNLAVKEFDQAVEKDPGFALGYAGLADTHLLLGRNGHVSPKFAYPKAIENAEKAISLDPSLPDPHVTLAAIRQEYEWKWDDAEREFKEAIALNPSNPIAHSWYALCLGHLGRSDEAINEAKLAQEFDPLSPRAHCAASEEYLFAREYDKAVEAAEKALEISPNFGGAFGYRAYAYVEKGIYDKAITDFLEAGRLFGARAVMGRLGHAYALSGNETEATRILETLSDESSKVPPKSPFIAPPPDTAFDIGLVCLGLRRKDEAIEWLEKATEERTAEVIHFKCEPIYDPLRDEPGFSALIKKIGLDR